MSHDRCLGSHDEHPSRAVRISVYMPAQLEEGTEVYAINEIPTSYSFVPCGYLVLTRTRSVFHTFRDNSAA